MSVSALSQVNSYIEDSLPCKMLACVPFAGVAVSLFYEYPLENKIKGASSEEKSRLTKIQNHYRLASTVRNTVTIALMVGISAYTVWHGPLPRSGGL